MDFSNKRIVTTFRVLVFILAYIIVSVLIGVFDRYLPPAAVMVVLPLLAVAMPLALVVIFRIFLDRKPVRTLGVESEQVFDPGISGK